MKRKILLFLLISNQPPVKKRTESAVGETVAFIPSTHSLKKFDYFFKAQKPRAISTNATAETTVEHNWITP